MAASSSRTTHIHENKVENGLGAGSPGRVLSCVNHGHDNLSDRKMRRRLTVPQKYTALVDGRGSIGLISN